MESINEGVYDWNVETGETYFSSPLRALLGFSADELATSDDWRTTRTTSRATDAPSSRPSRARPRAVLRWQASQITRGPWQLLMPLLRLTNVRLSASAKCPVSLVFPTDLTCA
jgi:hypothetical protein